MELAISLEEAIVEKLRTLPLYRQQEVLDFVEFLQSKSPNLDISGAAKHETQSLNAVIGQGKGWPPGFFEKTFGSCKDHPLVIDSEGILDD